MNDNDNEATSFLVEQPPGILRENYGPLQLDQTNSINSDDSVLSDMELGIRRLQVASSSSVSRLTDEVLAQIIPPFTRLQKLTEENIRNMNSIYGVVASVTDKTVLYSPVPETGVITGVSNNTVTLSLLNENSGILEENIYPSKDVSLHKYRLLYYLGNVKLFRGVTGRICAVLSMKYVRELLICLLYYLHKNKVDALEAWSLEPEDVVLFTQYTYVAHMNNQILNPSRHNYITLVSCLFKILKGCVKQLCLTSARGHELLDVLKEDAWGHRGSSYDGHTVSYRRADSIRPLHTHSTNVSSIQLASEDRGRYTVMSVHPVFGKSKYYDKVTVQGVAGLRVVFDKRCCLDSKHASLTFFRDDGHAEVIARFTGESSSFCAFTVRGNTLRYLFESSSKANPSWGYAFVIQPFEHVRWNGDIDVLEASCFDWSCFALDLVLEIIKQGGQTDPSFFDSALSHLIEYLRSSGMPFKSRVVELLIELRGSGALVHTQLPNIQ